MRLFSKLLRAFRRDKRPALDMSLANPEKLRDYDTQFLIDDSGSMAGSRWEEAREALMGMADIALKHDPDGVEVSFLNSEEQRAVRSASEIKALFDVIRIDRKHATPTGERVEQILAAYMDRLEGAHKSDQTTGNSGIKPLNLIVVTDGAPSDDPESVIVSVAKRLGEGQFPKTQVGIQFIQIGDDRRAKKALKELDNCLAKKHGIPDIVDTRPYSKKNGNKLTAESLTAMLLGGIDRRVDNAKKVQVGATTRRI
ncbi:hypothetical protein FRC07_005963 [Ceratobasidium sp. 392]|nr:hypothetical protein FRC07_005963 [Ceratobasidium sp. 392]